MQNNKTALVIICDYCMSKIYINLVIFGLKRLAYRKSLKYNK